MRIDDVLLAEVPAKFANRFEERQAFDIADGAADFDDQNVASFSGEADAAFDFIGDMRNDLHRRAEIIAAALFLNDGVVDLPGGAVVALAHPGFDEALVVPEVEVGFRAVIGDEDFAVLQRTHRAGIDVDVGIHFQEGDVQPARLEQCAERGRRQPLAERRNYAAGHENEFGFAALRHDSLPPANRY